MSPLRQEIQPGELAGGGKLGPRGVWALLEEGVGYGGICCIHLSVPQVGNLKAHLKIHIADGPLKCRECGKQFTTSGSAGRWGTGTALGVTGTAPGGIWNQRKDFSQDTGV